MVVNIFDAQGYVLVSEAVHNHLEADCIYI